MPQLYMSSGFAENLKAGRLEEALSVLQSRVREVPGDPAARVSLFDTHCLLGNWEKAANQLSVLRRLSDDNILFAESYRTVLQCELLRKEVFAGIRLPVIFGEPQPWMGILLKTNQLIAEGSLEAAETLRAEALQQVPSSLGNLDGQRFEYIDDADSRLGPMLEVMLEGRYLWVPFFRIRSIRLDGPRDIRDLVWVKAFFTWTNGGSATGVIPTRYVGTELHDDNMLRMARKTEWDNKGRGITVGRGQRMFETDCSDHVLLETRSIVFDEAATSPDSKPPTLGSDSH